MPFSAAHRVGHRHHRPEIKCAHDACRRHLAQGRFRRNAIAHLVVAGGAAPLIHCLTGERRGGLGQQWTRDQNHRHDHNDGLKSVPADGQNSVPRGR